jgi:hypothetical protein
MNITPGKLITIREQELRAWANTARELVDEGASLEDMYWIEGNMEGMMTLLHRACPDTTYPHLTELKDFPTRHWIEAQGSRYRRTIHNPQ